MEKIILHCDLNNFFASVECLKRSDLIGRPVAVCGDRSLRHGIVLAKNELAKKFGVQTGETLEAAKDRCPHLVFLPAHYHLYEEYSVAMRNLYRRYTDKIESFGIDECWLDVSESTKLFGDGKMIADELRKQSKKELGLTISSGVSYNKIFAKMASDYKKPDATTIITRENYKNILWPLPIRNLFFVGHSTEERFKLYGIDTIGTLARYDPYVIAKHFGKNGMLLHRISNGLDTSPVAWDEDRPTPKSIGNSTTTKRDLICQKEIDAVLLSVCDCIAGRLRNEKMKCSTVAVYLKNNKLESKSKRGKMRLPSDVSVVIFDFARSLSSSLLEENEKIRSVGVSAEDLSPCTAQQISLFDGSFEKAKREKAEETVDELRKKFGNSIITPALCLQYPELTQIEFHRNPVFGKAKNS